MTKFERQMRAGERRDHRRKGRSEVQKMEDNKAKAGLGGVRWRAFERAFGVQQRKEVGYR